jgi:hypothetical protein
MIDAETDRPHDGTRHDRSGPFGLYAWRRASPMTGEVLTPAGSGRSAASRSAILVIGSNGLPTRCWASTPRAAERSSGSDPGRRPRPVLRRSTCGRSRPPPTAAAGGPRVL